MKFDTYEINKIFYDHLGSYKRKNKQEKRYGFACLSKWNSLPFGISLNLDVDISHWLHSPYPFYSPHYLKKHISIYKIDQNRMMNWEKYKLYFLISKRETCVSLRELVLFMMYMKYLSNN